MARQGSYKLVLALLLSLIAHEAIQLGPSRAWGQTDAPASDANAPAAESTGAVATEDEKRIAELIEQLGADNFATRRRAQMDLARYGILAFEALQEAFRHPDPEVAAAAQYLINSAEVQWTTEEDSSEVKSILKNYDARAATQRVLLIDRLAALPDGQGWGPLARIAKFEPQISVSKYAVVALMNRRDSLDSTERKELAAVLRNYVEKSRRVPMHWLEMYTEVLEEKEVASNKWMEAIENENILLESQSTDTFDRIVINLYRWGALWLLEKNERANALVMARGASRVMPAEASLLKDSAYWAMDHQMPELVEELYTNHKTLFDFQSDLQYAVAESYRARGEEEKALELAQKAFDNRNSSLSANIRDPRDNRISRGYMLQTRAMFDWSEREFRSVFSEKDILDGWGLKARYYLAEMLHDGGKDKEASALWDEILPRAEKEEAFRQQLLNNLDTSGIIDPSAVLCSAFFYRGLALALDKDIKGAMKSLQQAYTTDITNADVLIAMYRLSNTDSMKRLTLEKIQSCADNFRTLIEQREQEMESGNPLSRVQIRRDLATQNNQLAWLISNTEGNFQEALQCSLRSLELEPETPGYLDTLGRCHYALKNYENAVAVQRRAVKLEPYAQAMKRQLKLFEESLAQSKASKKQGERDSDPQPK